MTKEQKFFLQVLADYVNQRNTKVPDGIDWQQIYGYAKKHQVQAIFGKQCKNFLLDNNVMKRQFEMDIIQSVSNYCHYLNSYKDIINVLKQNNVPFFPVKGLEIAALYPDPAFRTMGDIDIIVPEEKKNSIRGDIIKKGYQLLEKDYEHIYPNNNVNIEIHDHLVYKQNQEKKAIVDYFDRCWDYIRSDKDGNNKLDWNYHFVFLIEHTKKHFHGNGIGFRQFMDITVTARAIPDLDWGKIKTDLKRIGLLDFAETAFAFCKIWFDIDIPFECATIDESMYDESTELIFKNGVFGRDNEHHKEHSLERRMRSTSLPRPLSKMHIINKAVFLPYKYMIKLPYCDFLIGRRYLLPAAWIYRIVYIIRNKKKQLDEERRLLFDSEEIILQHNRLMKKWGL